jgi:glycosyltransferase involved in cell wall biosynthesis
MRIYHIVGTASGWGGLERCVTDLAAHQSREHTVAVAGAEGVLQHLKPGVQRMVVPMHHNRRDPRLLWSLRRTILDFRPDVIHAHAGKGAALANALRFFLPPIPRVATIHGTKKHPGSLARFGRVIAVSRRAGQSLGGVAHTVIWNGLPPINRPTIPADLSHFPFLKQGKPVFGAVGRLVEEKAFDVLLRAMGEVDGYLWIIGDGPLRGELEGLAKELGIADRVWFAGFRTDVPLLMTLADIMVISSRREGFPLALVEMLLLRRLVVGTAVGGVEEIIPTEWLCAPEEPKALADLMRKAANEASSLPERFRPVFDLAERELQLTGAARKIEAVYREAIGAT